MRRIPLIMLLLVALAGPAAAVNPDEMLSDPALEARAATISEGLRCLVCQNQSIEDSDADLARDLRLLVRERLVAGDSDAEVEQYLVDRYGEYVLLKPRFNAHTWLLWIAAPALLLAGLIGIWLAGRRQRAADQPDLSEDEAAALAELAEVKDDGSPST